MKSLWNRLIKLWKYLLRDELDIRRRVLNLAIIVIIIIQFPTIFESIFVNPDIWGALMQAFIFPVAFYVLWDINKNPKSIRPLLVILISIDFIIFPLMYFACGGILSAMPIWMTLGAVFIWILLDGIPCYVMFAVDVLVNIACFLVEVNMPQLVIGFNSEQAAVLDNIIGVVMVSFVIGALFMYQRIVYEKQRKMLEEQEEKLSVANEDLAHASEAKSAFLANMSHEIRTPINAVLGMDEMILRECDDETIRKYATDIDSAGHQLLAIINDILDFSKIESGKMEIHPAEYELYSIANDCFNMINMRAVKKNLAFSISNDADIPSYLVGDEIRVRQIIMNLLTNAVKYTKDGSVKLNLYYSVIDEDNINLIIEVTDSGVGIAPENIDKLFDSFKRIDEKANRSIEGTGLGLTITKKFIDLMGGTISVQSKLHVGSTFTVIIPQKVASKEPMGDFNGRHSSRSGSEGKKVRTSFIAPQARILVVDDVKMNLNVMRLLLKATQVQVDMAESGEESLAMTRMKHYDVILMDHMMPGMDGIETLRRIKSDKKNLNLTTPTIALTANAIIGVEELYYKEGFDAYLSKPVKGEMVEKFLIKYIPEEKVTLTDTE